MPKAYSCLFFPGPPDRQPHHFLITHSPPSSEPPESYPSLLFRSNPSLPSPPQASPAPRPLSSEQGSQHPFLRPLGSSSSRPGWAPPTKNPLQELPGHVLFSDLLGRCSAPICGLTSLLSFTVFSEQRRENELGSLKFSLLNFWRYKTAFDVCFRRGRPFILSVAPSPVLLGCLSFHKAHSALPFSAASLSLHQRLS